MIKNLLAKLAAGGLILGLSVVFSSFFIGVNLPPKWSFQLATLNTQYLPLASKVLIWGIGILISSLILLKVSGSNFFGITGIQIGRSWPFLIIVALTVVVDMLFGTYTEIAGLFSFGAAFMISIYLIVSLLKNRKSTKR